MQVRRLTLKREVLQELSNADLVMIGGGAPPEITKVAETMYSCLAYISCHILQCIVVDDTVLECIVN